MEQQQPRLPIRIFTLSLVVISLTGVSAGRVAARQRTLTPLQQQIENEVARLSSTETETRREAVTRLGAMARHEASRAAVAALRDPSSIVRATAAHAVLSLPGGEASTFLIPLLRDRDEFVRRETAYALASTRSHVGVPALVVVLETDKSPAVRGAAAVALGQIGDPSAGPALAGALSRRLRAGGFFGRITRRKVEEDEFVRRAAAISLGQLRSREGVEELIATLGNTRSPADVRREAARALGLIGDQSAIPALRAVLTETDPYLSSIAFDALRSLQPE